MKTKEPDEAQPKQTEKFIHIKEMVVQLFTSFFVYFYAIKKQLLEKRRKTLFLLNDILFLLILPFNMKQSALKLKQKQPYAYHI